MSELDDIFKEFGLEPKKETEPRPKETPKPEVKSEPERPPESKLETKPEPKPELKSDQNGIERTNILSPTFHSIFR